LITWLQERMTTVDKRARFDHFLFGDGNEPIVGSTSQIRTEGNTWRFGTGRKADLRNLQTLNKGRDRVFGQGFLSEVLSKSGRDHRQKQNIVEAGREKLTNRPTALL